MFNDKLEMSHTSAEILEKESANFFAELRKQYGKNLTSFNLCSG